MLNYLKSVANFIYGRYVITTLCICFFGAGACYAQEDFRLTQLSVNEGLSHSDVTSIVQDQMGYLWLGTNNGLNRYDGSKVKVFKGRLNVPGSLPDSKITKLLADHNNRIWIGTQTAGLCYYENKTQRFHQVDLKSALNYSNKITQSPFKFSAMLEDKNGDIWIAVRQLGIFILRIDTQGKISKIQNYPLSDLPREARSGIQSVLATSGNTALLGAYDGLHFFDRRTGKTSKVPDENNNSAVNSIFKDKKGNIWIGRFDGLYRFDPSRKNLSKVRLSADVRNIKTITEDSMGDIWLGCFGYGAFRMDTSRPNAETGRIYTVYPLNKMSLQTDFIGSIERVNCLLQDKYGLLWIGTSAGGAGYINTGQRYIKRIQNTPLANHILPDDYVTAVYAEKGEIWIGTRKGLSIYKGAANIQPLITGTHITSIFKDAENVFWVSTRDRGLKRILYETGAEIPRVTHSLIKGLPDDLIGVVKDQFNQLWVASMNRGVFVVRSGTTEALTFEKYSNGLSLSSNRINFLYKDPHFPWIWIATKDAGLDKIELNHDQVSLLKNYRYKPGGGGLSSDNIWPVKRGNDSTIWIGSLGGGLNKLVKGKNGREKITAVTTSNGLVDNDIEAIELDKKGNLWLAGYGLSKYDPKSGRVSFFDHNDGLQSNAFKVGAGFKDDEGTLYFGGINGLNYFDPESLAQNRIPPDLVFTDLKIFNVSVPIDDQNGKGMLSRSLNFTDNLTFSASHDFTIEFAGIQLAQHTKLIYQYKLEGYNRDWVHTDIPSASFSNLDPGTYQFLISASCNNVKSPIRKIEIRILPPWWLTWWAFAIYLFLVVMAFYIYRKIITKENSLKHELVIVEKEKELNRSKLEFFTTMSHELRTPLSLIYGPITELLQEVGEESKDKLWLMYRNTKRLMTLTNQLLDFRKIESGKLQLNAAKGDIVNFIREIWFIFKDKAKENSISYHMSTEKEKVRLYFDREKMELVFSNLLSNAFKYTGKEGSIKINIYIKGNENKDAVYDNQFLVNNYLEVVVEDNGIGIDSEEIEKIFDIYYQVTNSRSLQSTGTGLGLSIAKGIMDLHKGFIKVESGLKQGSRFIVGIPFGKSHLESGHIIEDYMGPDHLTHYDEVSATDIPVASEIVPEVGSVLSTEYEHTDSPKWKILLVEDNPELLEYLKNNFKHTFRVITAKDGQDGWEKVQYHLPDLVISDVMMPEMNGLELCRNIKRNSEYSFIPVLLLTARTASVYEIEGIETGADDYITKPFDTRLLNAKVNNFIQGRVKIREYYKNVISLKDLKPESNNADEVFLNRMIEVVECNLDNKDFGVLVLAQELAMSKSSLFKRVKDITGSSPVDFIRNVRIRKAAKLLLSGQLNVNEVALQVGISDLKYFREQFRRHYGTTPTDYVKQNHQHSLRS